MHVKLTSKHMHRIDLVSLVVAHRSSSVTVKI